MDDGADVLAVEGPGQVAGSRALMMWISRTWAALSMFSRTTRSTTRSPKSIAMSSSTLIRGMNLASGSFFGSAVKSPRSSFKKMRERAPRNSAVR